MIRRKIKAAGILGSLAIAGIFPMVAQGQTEKPKESEKPAQSRELFERYKSARALRRTPLNLTRENEQLQALGKLEARYVEEKVAPGPLGLTLVEPDETLRSHLNLSAKGGLVVTGVQEKSVGSDLGIHVHDLILKISDKPVGSAAELEKALEAKSRKSKEISLLRAGKTLQIEISPETLKKLPGNNTTTSDANSEAGTAAQAPYWIGVAVGTVEPTLRSQLGLKVDEGLLATQVVAESPASKAGVKVNDLLLSLGDHPINNGESLIARVQSSEGKPTSLKLIRAGKPQIIEIKPEKRPNLNIGTTTNVAKDQLFEALAVRPGVVVDPETIARYRLSTTINNQEGQPLFWTKIDNHQEEIDAKLKKLSDQIEALQKSINAIANERKEKSGR